VAAGEPPTNVGNISGFIRDVQEAGIGATEGLAMLREAGGAIRDSRWFALYGQVADTIAREPAFLALNPYQVPDASELGTWAMGGGNEYATQVAMQMLDRGTGLLTTQLATYVSDVPHTGVEAEAWAMDQFGDPQAESQYGTTVMGAMAVKYWKTVPYGTQ
jgi:hypothetical protein